MKKVLLALVAMLPGTCLANLVITFQQTAGNQVLASWSGSGELTGSGSVGLVLGFQNLLSNPGPVNASFAGIGSSGLTLSGVDVSTNSNYSNNYSNIDITNGVGSGLDSLFMSGIGLTFLEVGDTYTAMGSSILSGISFSDLNVGSYVSTTNDGVRFGSGNVTLNVVAIPEGNGIVFVGLAMCTTGLIFYGRQYMASRKAAA
jgi:hypothetical protein